MRLPLWFKAMTESEKKFVRRTAKQYARRAGHRFEIVEFAKPGAVIFGREHRGGELVAVTQSHGFIRKSKAQRVRVTEEDFKAILRSAK